MKRSDQLIVAGAVSFLAVMAALAIVAVRFLTGEDPAIEEARMEAARAEAEQALARQVQQAWCERLVNAIRTGTADEPLRSELNARASVVLRILDKELVPDDLRLSQPEMPCTGVAGIDNAPLWEAFVAVAADAASAWTGEVHPEAGLVNALVARGGLGSEASKVFASWVEAEAQKADLGAKDEDVLWPTVERCDLAERLGAKAGPSCTRARSRHRALSKAAEATARREEAANAAAEAREKRCLDRCEKHFFSDPEKYDACTDKCYPKLFDDEDPLFR